MSPREPRSHPDLAVIQAEAEPFLRALYGDFYARGLKGFIEVRIIGPRGIQSCFFSTIEAVLDALPGFCIANEAGRNIYIGVNPRYRERGEQKDVQHVVAVHVDADNDGGLPPADLMKRAAREASIVVSSGQASHAHLYWLLREPANVVDEECRARIRGINRELALALGGDAACHDLSRVLRLPGFRNWKQEANAALARLQSCDPGRRYDLAEFDFLHPTPITSSTSETTISASEPPQLSERVRQLLETHETLKLRWAGDPLGLNDMSKSGLDESIAAILAPECVDQEIADAIRLVPYNKDRQHKITPAYLARTIANARKWLAEREHEELASGRPASNTSPASVAPSSTTSASPTLTPEQARTMLADLLFAVGGFVSSYLAISTAQTHVLAVWVFHTHTIEAADRTPYLHVRSPEKRCGKSLLLDLLKLLVRNPWRTSNASPAAIPRKISLSRPTALFDEADTYIRAEDERGETLRGVLDAGFERGGAYSRCVGQGAALKVEDFDVFCPKAIAGLRDLPDTIADRSIPMKMKRALPGEIRKRFYRREAEPAAAALRARLESCAAALLPALQEARPDRVPELNDRQSDIAEPLLAIADQAGGGWQEYLRDFLRELFQAEEESEQSLGIRLLADLRGIFGERDVERLASAYLVQALRELPDAPWADWRGKGITAHMLTRMLRSFQIQQARWADGKTTRGYERKAFAEAWARYLPAHPPEGGQSVKLSEPKESTS